MLIVFCDKKLQFVGVNSQNIAIGDAFLVVDTAQTASSLSCLGNLESTLTDNSLPQIAELDMVDHDMCEQS